MANYHKLPNHERKLLYRRLRGLGFDAKAAHRLRDWRLCRINMVLKNRIFRDVVYFDKKITV